jgi:hypothetical protein
MRSVSAAGTTVVVAGHSRGVGKTTVIEEILRSQVRRRWAAVKVSSHRHCGPDEVRPLVERSWFADPRTQTGRYLIAGADRSYLCRTPSARLLETARFIRELPIAGFDVIVESNRIVDFLEPDVVLFVVAPLVADWKASSGVALPRTHAFVVRDPREDAALEAVRALEAKGRIGFAIGHGQETARLLAWLETRLPPVAADWHSHAVGHR